MHRAERVINRLRWRALEHHKTFFGRDGFQIKRIDDTGVASLASKYCLELLETRELTEFGNDVNNTSFSADFFQCDAALAGAAAAMLRNSGTSSVATTNVIMMARNASAYASVDA